MTTPELRTVTPHEIEDYLRSLERGFLEDVSDEEVARWAPMVEPDRFYAARDDHDYLATAGAFTLNLSMPGAAPVPCAGITGVTVRADHRRQGWLRRMMQRLLDDAASRVEPVAALYASEGAIYGRFGYGIAVPAIDLEVDRLHARPVLPADPADVRLVDATGLRRHAPSLHEAERSRRGGMMGRTDAWWSMWLDHDTAHDRDGGWSRRFHALLPERGYAVYRGKSDWSDRVPHHRIRIEELVAVDGRAYRDLWAFLAGIDLAQTIELPHRPVDDPLRHLVADEGRVRDRSTSPLWLRLVDLSAAVTARGYEVADTLVLDVRDQTLASNAGRWRLDTAADIATCARTDAPADLVMDVADLASVLLGGYRTTTLREAGRVGELTSGAAARLDRVMHVELAPAMSFEF